MADKEAALMIAAMQMAIHVDGAAPHTIRREDDIRIAVFKEYKACYELLAALDDNEPGMTASAGRR